MFQAALAALLKNGISPARGKIGHEWVQVNFSGQLIHRRKLLPSKFKSFLSDAQALRDIADYKSYPVSKKLASRDFRKAEDFIVRIQTELLNETQP